MGDLVFHTESDYARKINWLLPRCEETQIRVIYDMIETVQEIGKH